MIRTGSKQAYRVGRISALSTVSSLALMALAAPAMAQTADQASDTPAPAEAEATVDEDIVVTGYRAALESAQAIRRDSDTFVDVITAEDIGALPDRSVAEALQRVPGVNISRFEQRNDPDRFSVEGSGVIVRDDGIVVTNNHVVEGATELVVVLGDRREFPATVVLTDPRTDLAVLRIDAKGERMTALKFADTTNAQVGDQVLAIGNPFGVGQTVTGGIISALARTDVGITDYSFFIQTDASINPGNSGGALVDMNGDLVGVNTAIFSRSGTSAGVGFAIPAEMVKRVVEGAVKDGRVIRAWSGVKGPSVDAEIARTMGLARPGGILVTEVYQGSAAAQAGLRRGDIITGFAGASVSDYSGLRFQAATRAPGERVEFSYLRQGRTTTGQGTLSAPPGGNSAPELLNGRHSFDGVTVATLTPALAEEQGIDPFTKGVVVVRVSGTGEGARAGLRPGDVVLDTNDNPVGSVGDLTSRLKGGTQGKVTIQRGDRRITAVLFL